MRFLSTLTLLLIGIFGIYILIQGGHRFTFTIPRTDKVLFTSRFATLATTNAEGYPDLRVMRTWYDSSENVYYFRSFIGTGKDYQLQINPKCTLFFEDKKDERYTNITGTATLIWSDKYRYYYKFIPEKMIGHYRLLKDNNIYVSTTTGSKIVAPII